MIAANSQGAEGFLEQTIDHFCMGSTSDLLFDYKITVGCTLSYYVEGEKAATLPDTGTPSAWQRTGTGIRYMPFPSEPLRSIPIRFVAASTTNQACGISIDNVSLKIGPSAP